MKQPIDVTIDPEWPIVYLQYADSRSRGSLDIVRAPDGSVRECDCDDPDEISVGVVVDRSPEDEIVGIEIFDIDDPVEIDLARDYAIANHLAFPADIRAAARVLT